MTERKPCICGSKNLNSKRNPMSRRCVVFCEDCGHHGPVGVYEDYVELWNEANKPKDDSDE